MLNMAEEINKINNDVNYNPFINTNLKFEDRIILEKRIKEEIKKGNKNCYKFIPIMQYFEVGNLLTTGHYEKMDEENWYELITNIYLRMPSTNLLDTIARNARTNPYAFKSLVVISSKRPDIIELSKIIEDIKKNPINPEVKFKTQPETAKKNYVVYLKLISGLIVKIVSEEYTAYRFNTETNEWQEDSVLFTEFEHGNLQGNEIEFEDNYGYGEPFRYRRHL